MAYFLTKSLTLTLGNPYSVREHHLLKNPTCLEATGISFPDSFKGITPVQPDGIGLMAAVKGKELAKRSFFWEHHQSRAVYHDGWKLVDLTKDPREKSDLSKQYPERTEDTQSL